MHLSLAILTLLSRSVLSFPFVANSPGVDSSLLRARHAGSEKRQSACPFNTNHKGAAPYTAPYTYSGAKNGLSGSQIGNIKVPADGDKAHAFVAPGPNDIRGPCPGLNTAANHNFLSHDGITTFNELVDAQQNIYNVAYDLAVFLATVGVALDGDVITGKMSLGCDATSRTSSSGSLLGRELGLNGHNKFEGDTSLTRNDFFLANGDDYTLNTTLFTMMDHTCTSNFNRENLARYRSQRYAQSRADNENFYYGPKMLLLYGAASFLYELFPTNGGPPNLPTIMSFFGVSGSSAAGFTANHMEQIPKDWYSRATSYTGLDVAAEIVAQYALYPVLFGGNVGPGDFNGLGDVGSAIKGGMLTGNAQDVWCLFYQIATDNVPSSLSGVLGLPVEVISWVVGKLNPVFQGTGCPLMIQ